VRLFSVQRATSSIIHKLVKVCWCSKPNSLRQVGRILNNCTDVNIMRCQPPTNHNTGPQGGAMNIGGCGRLTQNICVCRSLRWVRSPAHSFNVWFWPTYRLKGKAQFRVWLTDWLNVFIITSDKPQMKLHVQCINDKVCTIKKKKTTVSIHICYWVSMNFCIVVLS